MIDALLQSIRIHMKTLVKIVAITILAFTTAVSASVNADNHIVVYEVKNPNNLWDSKSNVIRNYAKWTSKGSQSKASKTSYALNGGNIDHLFDQHKVQRSKNSVTFEDGRMPGGVMVQQNMYETFVDIWANMRAKNVKNQERKWRVTKFYDVSRVAERDVDDDSPGFVYEYTIDWKGEYCKGDQFEIKNNLNIQHLIALHMPLRKGYENTHNLSKEAKKFQSISHDNRVWKDILIPPGGKKCFDRKNHGLVAVLTAGSYQAPAIFTDRLILEDIAFIIGDSAESLSKLYGESDVAPYSQIITRVVCIGMSTAFRSLNDELVKGVKLDKILKEFGEGARDLTRQLIQKHIDFAIDKDPFGLALAACDTSRVDGDVFKQYTEFLGDWAAEKQLERAAGKAAGKVLTSIKLAIKIGLMADYHQLRKRLDLLRGTGYYQYEMLPRGVSPNAHLEHPDPTWNGRYSPALMKTIECSVAGNEKNQNIKCDLSEFEKDYGGYKWDKFLNKISFSDKKCKIYSTSRRMDGCITYAWPGKYITRDSFIASQPALAIGLRHTDILGRKITAYKKYKQPVVKSISGAMTNNPDYDYDTLEVDIEGNHLEGLEGIRLIRQLQPSGTKVEDIKSHVKNSIGQALDGIKSWGTDGEVREPKKTLDNLTIPIAVNRPSCNSRNVYQLEAYYMGLNLPLSGYTRVLSDNKILHKGLSCNDDPKTKKENPFSYYKNLKNKKEGVTGPLTGYMCDNGGKLDDAFKVEVFTYPELQGVGAFEVYHDCPKGKSCNGPTVCTGNEENAVNWSVDLPSGKYAAHVRGLKSPDDKGTISLHIDAAGWSYESGTLNSGMKEPKGDGAFHRFDFDAGKAKDDQNLKRYGEMFK